MYVSDRYCHVQDTAKLREKYIKLLKERSGDFSEEKSQPTNENDEEGMMLLSAVIPQETRKSALYLVQRSSSEMYLLFSLLFHMQKLKQKEEEQAETSNAYEEYKKIMKEKRKNRYGF